MECEMLLLRMVNSKLTVTVSCPRFRWIQCQIDTLKECVTAREIRKALDSLPVGLEATYARILHAIDQRRSERKLAQRALAWLVAALRPLQLIEIVEALSVDLDRRVLDHDIGPVHGAALLDALSSLVIYNEETDIVILSHFSVKVDCSDLSVLFLH